MVEVGKYFDDLLLEDAPLNLKLEVRTEKETSDVTIGSQSGPHNKPFFFDNRNTFFLSNESQDIPHIYFTYHSLMKDCPHLPLWIFLSIYSHDGLLTIN